MKNKSDGKVILHLSRDQFQSIHDSNNEYSELILKIIDCTSGLPQIPILKEIACLLTGKSSLSDNDILAVDVLAYFYHQIPCRSSLKKTMIRVLNDLANCHPTVVSMSLNNTLCCYISIMNEKVWLEDIKYSTTALLGVLESLSVGKDAIDLHFNFFWKQIYDHIVKILETIRFEKSPQKRSDIFTLCQALLKVLAIMLQQCEKIITAMKNTTDEDFRLQANYIENGVLEVLTNESTLLTCRLNAAIVFCLFVNIQHSQLLKNYLISQQFSTIAKSSPVVTQLCIFSGIMAVLPVSDIIAQNGENSLYEDILTEIIQVSKCTDDSETLLLCARTLLQWVNVMCQALKLYQDNDKLRNSFTENGTAVKILFQYVLCNREHFIDSMRYLTKDVFKSSIKLHLMASETSAQESKEIKDITLHLLEKIPPHSSGKYGLLSCLIEELGTPAIISWSPSLPEDLLTAVFENSMIPHIADVYQSLIRHSDGKGDDVAFQSLWIKPLLHCLCSGSKEQILAINDHILPKLLALKPSSTHFLISELSTLWKIGIDKRNCFSALIKCEKFYQEYYKENNSCISPSILENALVHADDQVRISAFSLLCESRKTANPVPSEILSLIRISLPFNINNQCPSFRQQFVAYIKKLLSRISDNSYAIQRKVIKKEDCKSQHQSYMEFLSWLKKFLFSCLHPEANFPRRVTALSLLSVLNSLYSNDHFKESYGFLVDDQSSAQTLLYALQDTYETNKQIVLNILSGTSPALLNFENKVLVGQLLESGLTLASSTKPPDSVTASYIFALLVQFDTTGDVAARYLQTAVVDDDSLHVPFESMSISDLQGAYVMVQVLMFNLNKQLNMAEENLLEAASSGPMYGILACIRSVISQVKFNCILEHSISLQWQQLFCKLLMSCLKVSDTVEPVVCNSSPEGHLPMDADSDSVAQLQCAVRRAIGCRFQSAVVEPEAIIAEQETPREVKIDLVKTHAVTAQMLLLCCWRTHKEVSLLFGEIAERMPIVDRDQTGPKGILTATQLKEIGEYFLRQLQLVKHRGAFEQAYVGFSKLCHTLWRSSLEDLFSLPRMWLHDLMTTIKGESKSIPLCSTRRSAGLPFIIQAILISEPEESIISCCKETLTNLFDLSLLSEQESPDSRVHALHILRALFRDTCLRENVMPYISKCFKVSILGFKSHLWAVRNASTLLFSALMTRVFGENRFQGNTGRKNRLTGKVFCTRYKDLYFFLHDELKQCAESLQNTFQKKRLITEKDAPLPSISIEPSLYPILLILGRLYPLPGELDPLLEAFIPLLHVCACSPIWKTRVLAAKALVPLISPESVIPSLQSLFDCLPVTCEETIYQNKVHGYLLQIFYILKELPNNLASLKKSVVENLKTWLCTHFKLALSFNPCYTTRVAFLEILCYAMSAGFLLDQKYLKGFYEDVLKDLESTTETCDKGRFLTLAVTVILLHVCQMDSKTLTLITCVNIETSELVSTANYERILISFMSCRHYEIRFTVLHFLVSILKKSSVDDDIYQEDSILVEDIMSPSAISSFSVNSMFLSCVLESNVLTEYLINMVMGRESHATCIGKLYQLLCLLPKSSSANWTLPSGSKMMSAVERLNWVLEEFKSYNRDEISNPLFMFMAHLALFVHDKASQNEKSMDNFAVDFEEHHETLGKWSAEVMNNTLPHQSISRRFCTVTVLRCISDLFLPVGAKILGNKASYLWQALFYTLIDDEPDIKDQASEIVFILRSKIQKDAVDLPMVATLGLGVMMDLFVDVVGLSSPSECLNILLNWMLMGDSDSYDDIIDEQPFDKGEMNVFAEDLTVTATASSRLARFLSTQPNPQDITISLASISRWNLANGPKQQTCDINDFVGLCLDEANSAVAKVLAQNHIFPFLNNHLDRQLVVIHQCVQVVLILIRWTKDCEGAVEQVKELHSALKKIDFRTKFICSLISQIEECVDIIVRD